MSSFQYENSFLNKKNSLIRSNSVIPNSYIPNSILKEIEEPPENTIKKEILPISSEFDMIRENFYIIDDQNRSDWYSRFLKENPEIKDFIERVDPISRATTFAKLYLPPNRIASQNILLSLISQHFRTLGLVESQTSLHEEWSEHLEIPAHLLRSQLNLIVQRGISNAESFWELSLPSPMNQKDAIQKLDQEISKIIGGTPYVVEDATPLSSETFGDSKFLVKQNDEIVEASLNQIIWLLTTENKGISDLMQAVCLTYRSFTTSKIFFTKIRERFRIAFQESEEQSIHSIAFTFKLFGTWMREAIDSIEQPVIDAAKAFAEAELKAYPNFLPAILSPRKKENQNLDFSKAPPVILGDCLNLWTGDFQLFDLPPLELARQLTVFSSLKYYSIARSELLDGAWNIPRLKHRSPNICALTTQFNQLASWVQTIILTEPILSIRIQKMKYLVEVQQELFKMQNYFDLFAIFLGFDNPSIFRLKQHRTQLTQIQQNFLNELDTLGSPADNSKNVLEIHSNALKSGKPSLPYLPVLLGILFKYTDGTEAVVNGLVNLRKCRRMLSLMKDVESFQKLKYIFLPIEQVQKKLMKLDIMDDDSLNELSYDVEPDGATFNQLKDLL